MNEVNKRTLNRCISYARRKLKRHPERFKHFSFVIQFNRILSIGYNRSTGKPLHGVIRKGYSNHCKIHAEFDALNQLWLKGFEVVNVRLNNQGELRNAAPCSCCFRLLKLFGCSMVYFTTNKGLIESWRIK